MKRILAIVSVVVFLSAAASGQPQDDSAGRPQPDPEGPTAFPDGSLGSPQGCLIRAGWLFDGRELLEARSVVIRDGRIEAVLEAGAPAPPGLPVVDASDCTVMPGLWDGHIHFMGSPLWQVERIDHLGWGKIAAEAYSRFPEARLSLLRNGVTTIIEMGSPGGSYLDLRRRLETGRIVGPEIYFPGPLFTAPNGHPAGTIYGGQHDLIVNGTVQVADELKARARVRELAEAGVDFIKIVYDRMGYAPQGAPRLDLGVARGIIEEAHSLGLQVFAHVGSEEEARAMVEAGVDGIEHSFGSEPGVQAMFAEMARRKVAFTPTLVAYTHYAPQAVPPMKETVKRAQEAGVMLVLGTDYPATGGRARGDDVYREMRLLEEAGVPRLEVLRAATSAAAAKIGKEGELGLVSPGCRANLVFVEGRADLGPLSSARIVQVMLAGNTVVERGELVDAYAKGFREKHVMVMPYFFWDPLSQFNFGLSLTDFDLFDTGVSLSSEVLYSLRNMWAANLGLSIPSPIPQTRLAAALHFDTMNRLYHGLGNDSQKADAVEYRSLVFREAVNTITTFAERWKLLGALSADQVWLSDYEGQSLPAVEGREGERLFQIGISAGYDSRDHAMNPWQGLLLLAGGELSPEFLGTSGTFGSLSVDLRAYLSPFQRHVIAARLLLRQSFGPAPFYYLPAYGGATVGRGYCPQRFADRVGLYGQMEYRFPIYKILSGAAWVDLGQVQPDLSRFTWKCHPAFGLGPRLAFGSNENSILAVDVGFSPEGWALYVRQGLAF